MKTLAPPGAGLLRWAVPASLLGLEFLALSLWVDFPASGPLHAWVEGLRVAIPVVIGTLTAGALIAGDAGAAAAPSPGAAAEALPPWRPLPALAVQPVAFAGVAYLTQALFGDGAGPPTSGLLALWLASAGVTALLAVAGAAPLAWVVRRVWARWQAPLLALACGLLVWRAATAAEALWGVASSGTLRATAAFLRLFSDAVTVIPAENALGLRGFEVEVAPVCSGVDGVGLVVTFLGLWMALARDRLRLGRTLWLLPLGAAAALAANVVRIAALLAVGASGREAMAVGGFHSKLGWIFFIGIAYAGIAVAERVPWFRSPDGPRRADPLDGLEAASLAPLVAALAAALVTGLAAGGALDPLYGVRLVAGGAAVLACRRALPSLRPTASAWPALVGGAAGVAWVLLEVRDPAPVTQALAAFPPGARIAWIAVRAVGAILVIPLVEELAFRGFVFSWLSPRGAPPTAARRWGIVLVSALAFASLHASPFLGALAGVAFGAVRLWRGRVGDAVVAHAAANAVLAAAVLGWGRWDLWM